VSSMINCVSMKVYDDLSTSSAAAAAHTATPHSSSFTGSPTNGRRSLTSTLVVAILSNTFVSFCPLIL